MVLEYVDFLLEVHPDGQDAYRVVAKSPKGEQSAGFQIPPDLRTRFDFPPPAEPRDGLRELIRGSSDPSPRRRAQEIGRQLFDSAFPGAIRELFLSELNSREVEKGVRIKISIDPREPRIAWLASLPWELLFLWGGGYAHFLALDARTPIVRYVPVPSSLEPAPFSGNLRILALAANPRDSELLDLDRECASLDHALKSATGTVLKLGKPAVLKELPGLLREQPFQVLHFMGHGTFDGATGRGALLLEDEDGGNAWLGDDTLHDLLRAHPATRLVVLNACKTAQGAHHAGHFPFSGLAARLLLAGLPAVIAMRLSVDDSLAAAFSRELYSSLAQKLPLEYAMTQGRLAMDCNQPGTVEWAIPCLYLNQSDGRLFDRAPTGQTSPHRIRNKITTGAIRSGKDVSLIGNDGPPSAPDSENKIQTGPIEAEGPVTITANRNNRR